LSIDAIRDDRSDGIPPEDLQIVGRHFQVQYVWGIQGVIGVERNVPRSTTGAWRWP
jgi:hypothetical protein